MPLSQEDIKSILGSREDEIEILLNPATPVNDDYIRVVADRMVQFANTSLNPTRSVIGDYDVAFIASSDPKNPLKPRPYYSHVFRHKRTERSIVAQVSTMYGAPVPFGIVAELSELALREKGE